MKLFNFKEFKENSASDVTLKDYLDYLDSNKEEVKEAISIANELGINDVASPELNEKMTFLDKLVEIIDGNKKSIVIQSIDKLSLEDLQFLYEDKLDVYKHELEELKSKLGYYDSKIRAAEDAYEEKMVINGYAKEYYDSADTNDFFALPKSSFEYVKNIIEQDELDEEGLKQMFSDAITFEAGKIKKVFNANVVNCMVNGIVALFVKCHKLNRMLSNKSDYIVNSLLADNGIGKIIVELFGKDISDNLFLDMQNRTKESNKCFTHLPKDVQVKLREERFNGVCFNGLFDYYYALSNGKENEFRPFDTKELDNLIEEKFSVEKEIELQENKIELEKQFIQDAEKLREYLKSQINLDDSNAPSYAKLDSFVELAQNGMKDEMTRISEIDEKVISNTNKINRLEEILDDQVYADVEEEVEDAISQELYIEPIVEVEQARYDQIKIMIDAQDKLKEIAEKIKELKANKVKSVVSKAHRQLLNQYTQEYNTIVLDTYSQLDKEGILLVEIPELIVDKEFNQLKAAPSKNKKPETFDDLANVSQVFWNMDDYRDEIMTCSEFTKENIDKLTTIQRHCVNELFAFSKNEDGIYEFPIEDEAKEYLLQCQETIVCLAKTLYNQRLVEKDMPKDMTSELSPELVAELKMMGFTSFEKEEIQRTIFALTRENTSLNDERSIIVEQCQDNMIEGINTVEEAIMYRDMLVGISEYCLPADEIIDVLQIKK